MSTTPALSHLPKPVPVRPVASPTEPIQPRGTFLSPPSFQPFRFFPAGKNSCRKHRPVVELTKHLKEIGEKKHGSYSMEPRLCRWLLNSATLLGQGSHGQVIDGGDLLDERRGVAIKISFKPREGAYEGEIYRRWQAYRIPHLVRLHASYPETIQTVPAWILVMDKAPLSLAKSLPPGQKLPFPDVLSLFRQLLETHKATSQHGEVHGDLSASNIVYMGGKLTVMDLGTAHCPQNGQIPCSFQTIWYRPPELLLGRTYDTSIDLWSIGCLIFQAFTGELFTSAGNAKDTLDQIIHRIGFPSRPYLERCPDTKELCHVYRFMDQPSAAGASLRAKLEEEARLRGLSEQQTSSLIALLEGIFKYEDRIAPSAALELCKQIPSEINQNLSA